MPVLVDLLLVIHFLVKTCDGPTAAVFAIAVWLLMEWLTRLWAAHDRMALLSQPVALSIMIVGLSFFLRLPHTLFRPAHVQECRDCGLARHDRDALHCKRRGRLLHSRTEGEMGVD